MNKKPDDEKPFWVVRIVVWLVRALWSLGYVVFRILKRVTPEWLKTLLAWGALAGMVWCGVAITRFWRGW